MAEGRRGPEKYAEALTPRRRHARKPCNRRVDERRADAAEDVAVGIVLGARVAIVVTNFCPDPVRGVALIGLYFAQPSCHERVLESIPDCANNLLLSDDAPIVQDLQGLVHCRTGEAVACEDLG
jgi:hypothetical protein